MAANFAKDAIGWEEEKAPGMSRNAAPARGDAASTSSDTADDILRGTTTATTLHRSGRTSVTL